MLNQNNMPGAGSIADTIEFMRKMWSGLGVPAVGLPSLSIDEINQRVADLKTVASWLELNLNMLRATVQTLEVQSATLSTLQAMGEIMTSRQNPASDGAASPFGFSAWPPQPEGQPAPDQPVEAPKEPATAAPGAQAAAAAPEFKAPIANSRAWWNLLQQQFQQAVDQVQAEQAPSKRQNGSGKATKSKVTPKPRTRAKRADVQSGKSTPSSRKPKNL